jgi:VWFA-related protein
MAFKVPPSLRMPCRHALVAFSIVTLMTAQENPVTTFRTESNLVSLNVSVFDQEGRVVKGLPQSAFTVFEDNQKQKITVFRQEDVPISLGLVIDTSGSMSNKRERVNSAALAMVKASNPDDQ